MNEVYILMKGSLALIDSKLQIIDLINEASY